MARLKLLFIILGCCAAVYYGLVLLLVGGID